LSAETIRGHVRACRRFFRWLKEEGYLDTNVAKRLEQPPKPIRTRKGIKVSDRNAMIREAELSPRDYALTLFLADTGCRVAGVVGLKLGDLDLENGTAEVFEKGRGGNKKARLVFFVEKTKRAMEAWLEVRPATPGCDFVFLATGKGGRISNPHGLKESGVYQVLKRLAKKAGVTSGFNPHNWRHGAARGMIKNGASLIEVCQLLGHSSVTVTGDFYGTFDEEELRESHREYSWID
jgi:site-specific recombinase XerD